MNNLSSLYNILLCFRILPYLFFFTVFTSPDEFLRQICQSSTYLCSEWQYNTAACHRLNMGEDPTPSDTQKSFSMEICPSSCVYTGEQTSRALWSLQSSLHQSQLPLFLDSTSEADTSLRPSQQYNMDQDTVSQELAGYGPEC